jgi:nucleoside-diphosphate-sugar epimerase
MLPSTALVTGAAGFIGGWVVESLRAAGFDEVRAGVRSERSARFRDLPVKIVHCDVLDSESLAEAVHGVGLVVNCARGQADSNVILEGTRRILSAAVAAGVSRIIQISSVAVYGNSSGKITEDTEPVPPLNKYAADKRRAEELCRMAAGPDLAVAVVRPSLVYGPFGEEWTGRFIRGIVSGQLKQLGGAGEGRANLIYAGDLAKFVAQLAVTELPHYSVFNANGSEIPTFNEYFNRLSQSLGFGPLPHSNARPVGAGLVRQARRAGRLVLRKSRPRLRKFAGENAFLASVLDRAEDALRFGFHDGPPDQYARPVVYSIERARQIGFSPQTSLQEGIEASVLWARLQGITDRSR